MRSRPQLCDHDHLPTDLRHLCLVRVSLTLKPVYFILLTWILCLYLKTYFQLSCKHS